MCKEFANSDVKFRDMESRLDIWFLRPVWTLGRVTVSSTVSIKHRQVSVVVSHDQVLVFVLSVMVSSLS